MTELSPRVQQLLHGLSPGEKISLLHQRQPAVERLGLAACHTGNETLHGVAWSGRATVFCQAVGLGATWDPPLLQRVGEAVGTEARAMHNLDPEVGLNAWAPVVNPLRHPAWGRNEEGYSEDPRLVADLAIAYAGGLRGDHPRFWRVTPTLKHLCAYNVEDHRDALSVQVPPRVLHEYELPAFLEPLAAGVVAAVMPSYNLVNGRAAHLSAELIEAARAASPHSLAVVSDAFAPANVFTVQQPGTDPVEAFAQVLLAGVDSFTQDGPDAAPTVARLTEALHRGLLTEDDVDLAVGRLLTLRELSGELDPEEDPWRHLGSVDVASAAHGALAREVASAAVVVLHDPAGLLPVAADQRVAVVGPMADAVLTDWYSGTLPYRVSVADALAERDPEGPLPGEGSDTVLLQVVEEDGRRDRWLGVADHGVRAGARAEAAGWRWQDWGQDVLTLRTDSGLLDSPDGRRLDARAERVGGWEVQQSFRAERRADGTFALLHLGTGRWVRLRPDGVAEVGAYTADRATRFAAVLVESGLAAAREVAEQADVVVCAVGNDPHLNGRETQDRPGLELPPSQVELIRSLAQQHPRVVVVVVSSYPYVLDEDVAALPLVWTSHGGQELGHAVVDVLTGVVEPRGRLPQPWPRRETDVGDRFDYDLQSHRTTSWWSPHPPRFALGHGRHYSRTRWEDAGAEVDGQTVTVTVRVSNTGDRAAPEVVQVYGRALEDGVPAPRRLLGHQRVDVAAGQTASVQIGIPLPRLDLWDVTEDDWWRPGRHLLQVARSASEVVQELEIEVAPRPRGWHRPASTAVRAECFERWEGLELVATGTLRGHALRPRGAASGTVTYTRVDAAGAARLVLRCRRPAGSPGGRVATVTTRLVPGTGSGADGAGADAAGPVEVGPVEVGPVEVEHELTEAGEVLLPVPVPDAGEDGPGLTLDVTLTGAVELIEMTSEPGGADHR